MTEDNPTINTYLILMKKTYELSEPHVLQLKRMIDNQVDELKAKGLSETESFMIVRKRISNSLKEEGFQYFSKEEASSFGSEKHIVKKDVLWVLLFSFAAGTLAKLPMLFGVSMYSITFMKNLSFFVLPFVVLIFALKRGLNKRWVLSIIGVFVLMALVVNLYPSNPPHHSAMLTGIHLPLLAWLLIGLAYANKRWKDAGTRMDFLKFTGESAIYGSLILFGLFVFSMILMVIFSAIGISVGAFIIEYVLVYGGSMALMITIYLVETKKGTYESFAPILAKIFSPLFFLAMVVFLIVFLVSAHRILMDRMMLIGFDLLLVLVLGMVIYSISAKKTKDTFGLFDYMNTALIAAALIVDGIALFAILFRLSEYGMTPNKVAALGENVLMFVNLAGLLWLYVRFYQKQISFNVVAHWQTKYLSVYAIWLAGVVFVLPIVFGFK